MTSFKKILSALFVISIVLLAGCKKECTKTDKCDLLPETGPCDAAFPRYYYDQEAGTCMEFIWGGCDGVVPFETLEECENSCHCDD